MQLSQPHRDQHLVSQYLLHIENPVLFLLPLAQTARVWVSMSPSALFPMAVTVKSRWCHTALAWLMHSLTLHTSALEKRSDFTQRPAFPQSPAYPPPLEASVALFLLDSA